MELVIRGLAGEPTLTADGRLPYFVRVLSGAGGTSISLDFVEYLSMLACERENRNGRGDLLITGAL